MPIIANIGRRTFKGRLAVVAIYALLSLMGVTMVVPFLITVSGSMTNDFDYDRFDTVPRYLWSTSDRFVKGLVLFFNVYHDWPEQMRARFRTMPEHWSTWANAGQDDAGVQALAEPYMNPSDEALKRWKIMAADYAEFAHHYPVEDMLPAMRDVEATPLLLEKYKSLWLRNAPEDAKHISGRALESRALELLEETWNMPLESVYSIEFEMIEGRLPYWHQSWYPHDDPKYRDYEWLKRVLRNGYAQPGVKTSWLRFLRRHDVKIKRELDVFPVDLQTDPAVRKLWIAFKKDHAPAGRSSPVAMRVIWRKYLESEEVSDLLELPPEEGFDADFYNRIAGTDYPSMFDTPFPVPADAPESLRDLWVRFVETRYPVRLTSVEVTPRLKQQFADFLRTRLGTTDNANRMLGTNIQSWEEIELSPTSTGYRGRGALRDVWFDFVKSLPFEDRVLTSSEHVFQQFLVDRYGTLEKINQTYNWNLRRIEEAFPPFDIAYAVTYLENEAAFGWAPARQNYAGVLTFLLKRGRAILVTGLLVALAIFATLTVNPLAAYGLSRFSVRGKDKIILFFLATMAFPAMVSAIPAYLLMRDLNMLNTFFALVLPYAANGMAIFILKGFFDSLPQELYDAATIDGAGELQIFARITMPMMKPILAIQSLYAFLWAYNSWEWALIICQKKSMWTMAVWMYQADRSWWADMPWLATAGYVVISIPTLLVFLFCQKIILRGIIIPSMK
jgi:ABC-type glycerol-3-phosphate transport system permease component